MISFVARVFSADGGRSEAAAAASRFVFTRFETDVPGKEERENAAATATAQSRSHGDGEEERTVRMVMQIVMATRGEWSAEGGREGGRRGGGNVGHKCSDYITPAEMVTLLVPFGSVLLCTLQKQIQAIFDKK